MLGHQLQKQATLWRNVQHAFDCRQLQCQRGYPAHIRVQRNASVHPQSQRRSRRAVPARFHTTQERDLGREQNTRLLFCTISSVALLPRATKQKQPGIHTSTASRSTHAPGSMEVRWGPRPLQGIAEDDRCVRVDTVWQPLPAAGPAAASDQRHQQPNLCCVAHSVQPAALCLLTDNGMRPGIRCVGRCACGCLQLCNP